MCNPAYVFQNLTETKDLRQNMETERKNLEQEELRRTDDVKKAAGELKDIKSDQPQFADRQRDYMKKAIERGRS